MYTYTNASNPPNLIKKLYIEYLDYPYIPFEKKINMIEKNIWFISKRIMQFAICSYRLLLKSNDVFLISIDSSHYSAHKSYQLPKIE